MVDWNKPDIDDFRDDVLDFLNDKIEHVAKQDYGSDTNIPVGSRRRNPGTGYPESWNGTVWTVESWVQTILDHIANVALHSGVPVGAMIEWGGTIAPPPSGWLVCDGTAISRATYSALHTVLQTAGYPFGAGDGSTTFNLPDFRGKSPLGKAASGTGNTLGQTFGALDHSHSMPNHIHAIAAHSHAMDHRHQGGSHLHAQTAHQHGVAGHYHDAQGAGATININGAGSHSHNIQTNQTGGSGNANRALQATNTQLDNMTTLNDALSNHVHPHGNVVGSVGNRSGNVNGDAAFNTDNGNSGSVNTAAAGVVDTTNISANVSGSGVNTAAVGLSTNLDGATTTGTNNHRCLTVHYLIKT